MVPIVHFHHVIGMMQSPYRSGQLYTINNQRWCNFNIGCMLSPWTIDFVVVAVVVSVYAFFFLLFVCSDPHCRYRRRLPWIIVAGSPLLPFVVGYLQPMSSVLVYTGWDNDLNLNNLTPRSASKLLFKQELGLLSRLTPRRYFHLKRAFSHVIHLGAVLTVQ